jgi:hypothetical protein
MHFGKNKVLQKSIAPYIFWKHFFFVLKIVCLFIYLARVLLLAQGSLELIILSFFWFHFYKTLYCASIINLET